LFELINATLSISNYKSFVLSKYGCTEKDVPIKGKMTYNFEKIKRVTFFSKSLVKLS